MSKQAIDEAWAAYKEEYARGSIHINEYYSKNSNLVSTRLSISESDVMVHMAFQKWLMLILDEYGDDIEITLTYPRYELSNGLVFEYLN